MRSEIDLLAPYLSNLDRPVFALRNLPEEVVAVLFAYYSRSTGSLRENLQRLISEGDLVVPAVDGAHDDEWLAAAQSKARAFHEKWVVGYGHSSVAEHAMVHLAIEEVSIVATKVVEDHRLASYTEKSTRYVPFDDDSFVREPAIADSPDAALYDATCRHLLGLYTRLLPEVTGQVAARFPRPAEWPARRYDSVCRSKACDLVRYLLPAATRTNLGLTINGRALAHLLTKLYSHPLGELRELAAALRREAEVIVPTLIKYAGESDYLVQTRLAIAGRAETLRAEPAPTANGARLLRGPDEPLAELATAILYEGSHLGYDPLRTWVDALGRAEQLAVIDDYLARRGKFDSPGRALEHLTFTFELTVDYGAYRDIQRHRMCTQTGQVLDTSLGYETPAELVAMGHGEAYHEAMRQAAEAHAALAERHGEEAAQYVLPLAWRKRLLMVWNLRELHHFISLRSGRQGHESYRRLAQDCWRELDRVYPELAAPIRVDLATYDLARA